MIVSRKIYPVLKNISFLTQKYFLIESIFVKKLKMTKQEKFIFDEYLKSKEVAVYLKCSVKTVYNRTKQGILKRYALGGSLKYYKKSEIDSAFYPFDK